MKISFGKAKQELIAVEYSFSALIAGALSQSTNSSVTSLPEQGIPE